MNSINFTIILVALSLITGLIWLLDAIFFKHKRNLRVISSGPFAKASKEPLIIEQAKSFFPVFVIVLLLRSFVAEPYRIPSGSMRPSLLEGDFIIVNKFDYGLKVPLLDIKLLPLGLPKRGDVIVFYSPSKNQNMIKRVVALPNDHVKVENNVVYVNNAPLRQEFIAEVEDIDEQGKVRRVALLEETIEGNKHTIYVNRDGSGNTLEPVHNDYVVPQNCYYVMGDNRNNSYDSRWLGCIAEQDILGRAFGIWLSYDQNAKNWLQKLRWPRLGSAIN